MARVRANKTTKPGKALTRSMTMKAKKSFKASAPFRKQHKSFIITMIEENKLPKKVPSSGFVVTENTSGSHAEETVCENEPTNTTQYAPVQPKLKRAKGIYVNDIFVLRKEFSIINDDGKEETYFVDEPFEDDLEDGEEDTSRIDELNESWNAAYSDLPGPGTPTRVSFGSSQEIVVDRVRWSKKTLRDARKGPWLKWAFMRKQSGQESWTVSE